MTNSFKNPTETQSFHLRNEKSKTPLIVYHKKYSRLTISGHSLMPNADAFFQPHIAQVYQDLTEKGTATVELQFDSFGPKTAKVLFKFFENLRYFKIKNKSATIIWKYQSGNDSLLEMGEAFSELFDLNFELQPMA